MVTFSASTRVGEGAVPRSFPCSSFLDCQSALAVCKEKYQVSGVKCAGTGEQNQLRPVAPLPWTVGAPEAEGVVSALEEGSIHWVVGCCAKLLSYLCQPMDSDI